MKIEKARIVILILAGIIAVYASVFIIYNLFTQPVGIGFLFSVLPVLLIAGVFDAILLLSAFNKWGALLKKAGRHSEAESYDSAAQKAESSFDYEEKNLDRESRLNRKLNRYLVRRAERRAPSAKNVVIGVVVCALLCGVAAFMFWLRARELKKYDNPNYVKTTAVAQPVRVKGTEDEYVIRFVYADEEGNKYLLEAGALYGSLKNGQTCTAYYEAQNHAEAHTTEDVRFMIVGSAIFMSMGILILFINLFPGNNSAVSAVVGSAFFVMGGVPVGALAAISETGIWSALMGGVATFGFACFALIGAMLAVYGFGSIINDIYCFILCKKRKKL